MAQARARALLVLCLGIASAAGAQPLPAAADDDALRLQGATIALNGGSKAVARVGSAVAGGVVANGAPTVLVP